eukprot:1159140-Pelagomonas_calceolata.AAC.4
MHSFSGPRSAHNRFQKYVHSLIPSVIPGVHTTDIKMILGVHTVGLTFKFAHSRPGSKLGEEWWHARPSLMLG